MTTDRIENNNIEKGNWLLQYDFLFVLNSVATLPTGIIFVA